MVGFDLSLEVVDGGLGEDECNFLLEEGDEDLEFRDLSSELLLKVRELFIIDTLSAHSDDFLDEGLGQKVGTFLEMTRMLLVGLRNLRISWIWFEPTLVKVVRMICL